jgi:hypothetical protein
MKILVDECGVIHIEDGHGRTAAIFGTEAAREFLADLKKMIQIAEAIETRRLLEAEKGR